MPVRLRVLLLSSALIAIAGADSACSRDVSAREAPRDTLYIGVAAMRANVTYFNGVTLALERLNAERPKNAPWLALRLPPEVQTSQVKVAEFFRDDPRVIGVVGHTGSAQTMDAAPVYGDMDHDGEHAVVAITPTATNPAVTKVNSWVFRVCPTDDDAARQLARFAIDSVKARRVAILYRNDLFGRGFSHTITPELTRNGATVVERDPYLATVTEYQAYALRMASRKVDVVVVAGGGADAADMIRALKRTGASPTVLGTDDVANVSANAAGGAAPGEFQGVRFTAFYDAERAKRPDELAFVRTYRERYKQTPNHQAALSYDAAMVIGLAMHAVGPNRRAMRDWIANLGHGAPGFEGLTGDIRFAGGGDAIGKQVLIGKVAP
jgi:branched-chain amino acid transport system substrate-binding protein